MKRYLRPLGVLLVLILLAGAAGAAAAGDSLISLSYLRETFYPSALRMGEKESDRMLQETYNKALGQLDAAHAGQTGGGSGAGQSSDTLAPRDWSDGEVISLTTGSGFLLVEGSASAEHSGVVVDVTAGTELASGGKLTAGHRYLVGEGTGAWVTVRSGQALLGIQGDYSSTPGFARHTPFYDIPQDLWCYDAVNYAYTQKLFNGIDEHHFDPEGVMNRAMLVSVLHRLAGSPAQSGGPVFTDVPAGEWYSEAVAWGAKEGITLGVGGNAFAPTGRITREQAVGMLYNYTTKYLNRSTGAGANLSAFPDEGRVSGWARTPMAWAVELGIINGSIVNGTVTLAPQGEATRAQMAAMLRTFCEKVL